MMKIEPTLYVIGSTRINDGNEVARHTAFVAQRDAFAKASPPCASYGTRACSSVGMGKKSAVKKSAEMVQDGSQG